MRGKKTFVMFADHHHGDPHTAIWAAAPPGVTAELVAAEPARFFVPPYVGHRGWLGLRLDLDGEDALDEVELAGVAADAYRHGRPEDPRASAGRLIGGDRLLRGVAAVVVGLRAQRATISGRAVM